METTTKPKHIGRNISRIRELRQMKQEALAQAIGVSQQTISTIENSESVDEEKLQQIANALGVSAETLKNFSEDAIFNYFNSFHDSSVNHGPYNNCTFNPLDKVIELYERLLEAEREKNALLEQLKK
jgi:transcriptional regulator with XRE-family HTH domain